MCELYVLIAALVLRMFPKMRLYETTADDLKYDYDLNLGMPSVKSKGIRVIIL